MSSQQIIIRANEKPTDYWRNLWAYRELFFFFAWRDILVRYKQTVIGIAWALLRPLLTMAIFVIVFSKIAKLPSVGDAPYAITVFAALLPWQFFAGAVTTGAESLINNANMISKVYFPRMILPISTIVPALMDFGISFLILLALYAIYGFMPGWQIFLMPVFLLMLSLLGIGITLFIAGLNVSYRDFRYIIPFLIQIGLYISPIGYASTVVGDKWRILYSLNPVVGIIDGFRWTFLSGEQEFYWPSFGLSCLGIMLSLTLGIKYFRSVERYFADRI